MSAEHSKDCICLDCTAKEAAENVQPPSSLAAMPGSVEYRRGYASGYQAGLKRGLRELKAKQRQPDKKESETGDGYVCKTCGIQRPRNWLVYEVEKDGSWLTPCCAMCARENKSRGPFPPNDEKALRLPPKNL